MTHVWCIHSCFFLYKLSHLMKLELISAIDVVTNFVHWIIVIIWMIMELVGRTIIGIAYCIKYTVQFYYNAISSVLNTHNRNPIAHPNMLTTSYQFSECLIFMQSSAVITRSNIVRFCINNCRNWDIISIRCWIHKRHPILRPNGRVMGCLLWIFVIKLTAL